MTVKATTVQGSICLLRCSPAFFFLPDAATTSSPPVLPPLPLPDGGAGNCRWLPLACGRWGCPGDGSFSLLEPFLLLPSALRDFFCSTIPA